MKIGKLLRSLSLATLLVASFSSITNAAGNEQTSLVALGDSITFGYNLEANNNFPSKYAFPSLIGSHENLGVVNLGIPGWTSNDLLKALRTPNSKFQLAVKEAKVITLDIGSNDILQPAIQYGLLNPNNAQNPVQLTQEQQQSFEQAIQQFTVNLPIILQTIKQLSPSAKIVLYNIYDPIPSAAIYLHPFAETIIGSLNIAISMTATKYHLKVANAYTAFNGKQFTLVRVAQNDVHPTIEGQKVLAKLGEDILDKKPVNSDYTFN